MSKKYFCYDGYEFMCFTTLDEARNRCKEAIEFFGEDLKANTIKYGKIIGGDEALVERYFKPKTSIGLVAVPDQPRDDWVGPENDDVLLEKMMKAKDSARVKFGNAAGFTDLFEGRTEVLSRVWPDEDRPYDASSADAALAQHLAFWTGCDGSRMINIMKRSQLVRDKWNRDDYLDRTVLKACNMQGDVYKDPRQQIEVKID